MSYAEKRKGALTGMWIGERVLKGSRVRCRALTKAEADKWEAYVDATGTVPLDGTGASAKHSLGYVAKEARSRRKGWKGSQDTSLDQRLEVALKFFTPQARLESLTNERLYDFVAALEQRKGRDGGALSGKTINRYLAVVSGLLDFSRELGWTTHSPRIPWQEEDEGSIEFLSREEEALISDELDENHRKCLRLLTLTGMRAGEFFELRPAQVDVASNECAWVRLRGDETKGKKSRNIPVHDFTLARWLKAALMAGELPGHHEFYTGFKKACEKLGLSEGLCVHSLRHTTATRLAGKVKGAGVQDFMGHASYKTTQKYIHLTDQDRMAAAATLVA